jgi:hypothetical protein
MDVFQQELLSVSSSDALGMAREGEVIGDDALDDYLDLFARPFRQQHLDMVLRLFGWTPTDLQSSYDAPVECLT